MAGGWEGTLWLDGVLFSSLRGNSVKKKKFFSANHAFNGPTQKEGIAHVLNTKIFRLQLHLQDKGVHLHCFSYFIIDVVGSASPPLRVFETASVCLTKPISQTGVEYQSVQGNALLPSFLEPVFQSPQSRLKNSAKYLNVMKESHKFSDLV